MLEAVELVNAEAIPHQNEEERLLIQRSYRRLLQGIKGDISQEDKANIRQAFEMAVSAHGFQTRNSGEPYILHPIEVARICVEEIGLGPTTVVCALLHDVVEDTDIKLSEIREKFGERVATIVDGLTKLDSDQLEVSHQAANLQKVLKTLVDDVRVVLIKMADRLHNMRTLGAMPRQKQLKIASETSFIYAPLAHRLGLYEIKTEFEDLCLKITDPEAYHGIANKLNETKKARHQYIEQFIEPLREHLDDLKISYRVIGRAKSIYSIWNKIRKKNVAFEQIYDLFAIRIVAEVPLEMETRICWWIYSIVGDVYKPIPERLKDWIHHPKLNGYQSLHTTVVGPDGRFVEVQIRTERMNEIAERGFAAHWKYKSSSNQPDVYSIWLDSIRELLEDSSSDALEFLQDFKSNLFKDEVYVFTPKGDMKTLPAGATALDFAFWIHSDLGSRCAGVHVNGKLVPLNEKLNNGDQITVLTNSKQKPNVDWLRMVTTSKAKSIIRSAIKEEKRKVGEDGKASLERKLKHLKVDFEQGIEFLTQQYKYKSAIDLFYDIAVEEKTIPFLFKNCIVEDGKLGLAKSEAVTDTEKPQVDAQSRAQLLQQSSKVGLFINGEPAEQYPYQLGTCCAPVQGDEIFAYLSVGSGIRIHRISCPNAEHMMANYAHRIMKAEWATTSDNTFVANVRITGIDSGPGVIEKLTRHISSHLNLNIRALNISGEAGYFIAQLSLLVQNKDQLYLAINAIQNLENVSTVERTK